MVTQTGFVALLFIQFPNELEFMRGISIPAQFPVSIAKVQMSGCVVGPKLDRVLQFARGLIRTAILQ